ncbi:MAG: hypothetical protein Q9177_003318 [Variospora cf. flavescens]
MALDGIKARMQQLRVEADASSTKVEELTAKVKTLEQENLAKEQEITSLTHKNQVAEGQLEDLHGRHDDLKKQLDQAGGHGTQNEALQRRLQILEEEAEEADKNLRETNDKYGRSPPDISGSNINLNNRLRQTDVKAGHYERKVQALESARDQWEEKYEEMSKKYAQVKKELEDFQLEIGNI